MAAPYYYDHGVPRHTAGLVRAYTDSGWWGMETLYSAFEKAAQHYGNRIALVDRNGTVSYAALCERVERLASAFHARGVTPGTVVVVQLPNRTEFVETAFAAARLGALFCPLNLRLRGEIEGILGLTEPPLVVIPAAEATFDYPAFIRKMQSRLSHRSHIVVIGQPAAEGLEPFDTLRQSPVENLPPQPDANDPWLLEFTSGTTAAPKGVVQSHNTTLFTLRALVEVYRTLTPDSDDVGLAALPISFIFPFYVAVLLQLVNGATSVLQESVAPEDTLALVAKHRVTLFPTVPALVDRLLEAQSTAHWDLSSLRVIKIAGDIASRERKKGLMEAMGCDVRDAYGLTECTWPVGMPPDAPLEKKLSTTGRVCRGMTLRIVDESGADVGPGIVGQIMVRGPSLMAGYYRNPEATREAVNDDGWFATGDLGVLDGDGYLQVVGRKKDLIITGGVNVLPQEVEEWLARHARVKQAAVFGVPDLRTGEAVWACVVPRPGANLTEDELQEFLRGRIAAYKIPDRVLIVEELPVSPTGKVLRRELKERTVSEHLPLQTSGG